MIILKLSFYELEALKQITGNLSQVLLASKNDLYLLCGFIIHDLTNRLSRRISFSYNGKRTVKLNEKECLALHNFLMSLAPQEDAYYRSIRYQIFQTIDKKLL